MNSVTLVGCLADNPELRMTVQRLSLTSFTLTVNRPFKNTNGEREGDFIKCIIWRKQAENFVKWIKQGELIAITGHLQTRSFKSKGG